MGFFVLLHMGRDHSSSTAFSLGVSFSVDPPVADLSNWLSDCQFVYHSVCRCPRLEGACTTNPCRHGGTCLDHWSWQQCQCVDGFTGRFCEKCKYMPLKCLTSAEVALSKEYSIMIIYDSSLVSHQTAPCSLI